MEYKVLILLILYVLLYIAGLSGIKKLDITDDIKVRLRNGLVYILVLVFGWNLILDTVHVLQGSISLGIKALVGGFFILFYTFVVFWQYRSRSGR